MNKRIGKDGRPILVNGDKKTLWVSGRAYYIFIKFV